MKKTIMIAMIITIVIACTKKPEPTKEAHPNTYNPARANCWICWQCDVSNNYKIIPSTLDTFCDSAKYEYYRKFTYPTVYGCKHN